MQGNRTSQFPHATNCNRYLTQLITNRRLAIVYRSQPNHRCSNCRHSYKYGWYAKMQTSPSHHPQPPTYSYPPGFLWPTNPNSRLHRPAAAHCLDMASESKDAEAARNAKGSKAAVAAAAPVSTTGEIGARGARKGSAAPMPKRRRVAD